MSDECGHTNLTGYKRGCRTDTCVERNTLYQQDYYANRRKGTNGRTRWPDPDFTGYGILRCGLCDRPYVEHRITDRCYL